MKKLTYSSILMCLFIWFFVLPSNVKADEMIFGANGSIRIYNGNTTYVNINQSANNLPKTIYGLTGNGTLNLGVIDLSLSPASGNINVLDNSYNYLIFDTCLSGNITINISNNGCSNSCVATGSYQAIKLSTSCTTGGNSGNRFLIQVPIQKWYLNEVAEMLEATSFITISNNVSWAVPVTINQVFLSNEDYTVLYANQQELINKLNSVQTAITNMQNSINSNANTNTQSIINNNNTNTQNIINNQNTNAQQAHTDAQNTQNTIKDDSVDSPNSSINTIKGSLASNGVITSLVVLPVTLYQAILNSVNGTCSTFSLGTLYGTSLTIPCINVSNYLGTTLWGSIDVIISGIFIYMISRKMVKVFHQLSSLKEGDVLDG